MSHIFTLGTDDTVFINGARLDPLAWRTDAPVPAGTGQPVSAQVAMKALSRRFPLRHLVVGVIGPREATAAQVSTAEALGEALGVLGVTVICGGRSGVMEAVCKGVSAAGGLAIGILPGSTPDEANPFVGIPLPTGLGEARNMIIAKSARVLIAVGGSYGTLTEVAYGLHFGKAVIGLSDAPRVEGVQHADSVGAAIRLMLEALAAAAIAAGQAPDCKSSSR
ncbi:TIGR00725 family protein [Pararhodobacter sp.]|uniref:TIGR00725 family protein n=1 Tax=Pararhodobacter sp. TaxID=2127056 RepID=UPI002FDEF0A0